MEEIQNFIVTAVRDISIDRTDGSREPAWLIEMSLDGGDPTHAVGFPHSIFHWRIAEYGIDPEDIETLLDIALHEQYIQLHHSDPTFLHNTDQETARLHHLARVKKSKQSVTHADPNNLLDVIRNAHDPYHPRIAEFRDMVWKNRKVNGT